MAIPRPSTLRILLAAAALALVVAGTAQLAGQRGASQPSGCVTCHASLAEAALAAPVKAFDDDVHKARGFSCVDCHGGDATSADKAAAKRAGTGYRGKPSGVAIITTCARCHSDAAFMRRYAPRQRVDQEKEYATSVHGQQLAKGDTRVATCVSCHGNHGIRLVSDAKSPVFSLNVEATCSSCHADPAHMAGYTLADGSPLPTDQKTEYEKSVHFEALTKRNDHSAPTCNDCHGNHGAAPPGVGSVANVCGTCHAVFQIRYATSTHSTMFECAQCHGNHAVQQPSDEMLGTAPPATCAECHAEGDAGFAAAGKMRANIDRLKAGVQGARALIDRVSNAGLEMSDQELALGEAGNKLTLARTEVHAFKPEALETVVNEGMTIVQDVEAAGRAGEAELRFRRTGLAWSLVAILLVVVALAFKIRQIDKAAGLS